MDNRASNATENGNAQVSHFYTVSLSTCADTLDQERHTAGKIGLGEKMLD